MNWIEHIKQQGDPALRQLYKEHKSECLQWLKRNYNLPDHLYKEIFQQAVVILYDNVVRGKANSVQSSVKTYLFGIAKNKAYEFLRHQKKWGSNTRPYPELIEQGVSEMEEDTGYEEKMALITKSLQSLGDPCRTLLKLYYYQEMSMQNISHLMGYKNADTTKNLKYKCLKRLRKIIFDHKRTEKYIES